ncbi:MAG: hypothetical protein KDB80_16025 [Planctomycetes bacterium]|nr:hypothetical protein [Planctomycetota bacterium]
MHHSSFASLVLASTVVAQVPSLALDGEYHVGQIGIEVLSASSPPGFVEFVTSTRGTLLIHPDFTWASTKNEHTVDASSSVSHQVTSDSGNYRVGIDSSLLLAAGSSTSGSDLTWLTVKPDASVLLGVSSDLGPESWIRIGIRASSGRQYSDLSGSYYFASVRYVYGDPSGVVTIARSGVATFDGVGSVSLTGTEREVDSLGTIVDRAVSFSGPYTITSTGGLDIGGMLEGGFSANGDLFFGIGNDAAATSVELMVGARIGPSYDFADLAGKWSRFDLALDNTVWFGPTAAMTFGLVEVDATSPTTGSFSGTVRRIESSLAGVTSVPLSPWSLWVDLGRLIAVPSRTLSPSGEARWDLPVPTNPIWLSNDVYTQVLIIDPGVSGGLAMTAGLQTVFCR